MNDSLRMVEDIINLIVAESIATLVETEDDYSRLHDLFIRSGEDIVENYASSKYGIDLSTEYQSLHPLVEQVIDTIGSDLFCDMWDADESSTLSEVLRCFGHGVSFWDNHNYQDFGFNEMPKLKTTLESPHDIASTILDKITDYHPEYQPTEIKEEDNVYTFKIPENCLSLIFNDDASGLSEEDIEAWKQFEQQMIADGFSNGYWSYPDSTESYFSYSNDVHNLGDNVVDLQWVGMS